MDHWSFFHFAYLPCPQRWMHTCLRSTGAQVFLLHLITDPSNESDGVCVGQVITSLCPFHQILFHMFHLLLCPRWVEPTLNSTSHVLESSSLVCNKSSVIDRASESLRLLYWGAHQAWVLLECYNLAVLLMPGSSVKNSSYRALADIV